METVYILGGPMGRPIELKKRELNWLRRNHRRVSYTEQAKRIGVSVDTLKRLLVKHGIAEFDGAKYARPPYEDEARWTRPCIKCGSTEDRPRAYYMCSSCRSKNGYTTD